MQKTRIFNADVGDESVGNAGPDAIEQDLDNLYENKTWNEDVLTKDNTFTYIPAQEYHPATKKYVDDSKKETLGELNQIAEGIYINKADRKNVLELNNVIRYWPLSNYNPATKEYVDTVAIEQARNILINNNNAQLINTWSKNLETEALETNFEDYVTGLDSDGSPIGNENLTRDYLRIESDGIFFKHQEFYSDAEDYYRIKGQQVYFTKIRGANMYRFFSFTNPLLLSIEWQPNIRYEPYRIIRYSGNYYYVSDTYPVNGYETWADALPNLIQTSEEEHKVKVKMIASEQEKANIQFNDIDGIREVLFTLGVGDGMLEKSAKAEIYKGINGLEVNYYKSNTGEKMNLKLDDTGIHANNPIYSTNNVRNIIITSDTPDVSMGNVNDIIVKVGV